MNLRSIENLKIVSKDRADRWVLEQVLSFPMVLGTPKLGGSFNLGNAFRPTYDRETTGDRDRFWS